MMIPIVNEQDEIVEYKDRKDIASGDIFRVTALWATDEEGNILIARRAYKKKRHGGLFSVSVAGVVEKGETYEQSMLKEMKEELGLEGIVPLIDRKCLRPKSDNPDIRSFNQHFRAVIPHDYPFVLQKEEVAEVRWMSKRELADEVEKHPEEFTPGFRAYYKIFIDHED